MNSTYISESFCKTGFKIHRERNLLLESNSKLITIFLNNVNAAEV